LDWFESVQVWLGHFVLIANYLIKQKAPSTPLQGCGALISSLTRLLNHSVKIGHIPIYIGIEWDFILCELMIWWIISFHNNLRRKY
jgi:hypothetical protein